MQSYTGTEELYNLFLETGGNVCTDTRVLRPGSIYFALKGQNFDGNKFAHKAIELGCSYAVTDDPDVTGHPRILPVRDVLKSLQELANTHRRNFNIPVLAITGSNGKTTTKELIHAVVTQAMRTLATKGNLNNHIGVPLTLLELRQEHKFAIIEMGANHIGEIAALCRIAEPDFGLITNIGKAHLEGFGGPDGVKQAKGELYEYLREKGGRIFINGDDDLLTSMAIDNDKITYGSKRLYDVIGMDLSSPEGVSLKYTTRYGEKDWNKIKAIDTQINGAFNFINCLAAVCAGVYFKVNEEMIRTALENYIPGMNRSQVVKTTENIVILDAYNANPDSMKTAIENFSRGSGDKLLILGDMFELGEYSAAEHKTVTELARSGKFDDVILVGEEFNKASGNMFRSFRNTAECVQFLSGNKIKGKKILIKGSRGMKLETLLEYL